MKVPAVETASLGRPQRFSKYEYLPKRYFSFFDFSGTTTRSYTFQLNVTALENT